MVRKRSDDWESDTQEYTQEQIESLLAFCNVEIENLAGNDFVGYCPFHSNSYDPAFAISATTGLWICYNPSCAASGTAEQLLGRIKGMNKFESMRKMLSLRTTHSRPLTERLEAIKAKAVDLEPYPFPEQVERMQNQLWEDRRGLDYLVQQRGLDEATLKHFGVGYSTKRDTVVFPMHNADGSMLLGFVGRSVSGKGFDNSKKLPKSATLWNLHRARKAGGTVIVVESCIDAMRVHQAGYPNVVALLGGGGGGVSEHHIAQLDKYFETIIIMTDFEKRQFLKADCQRCKGMNWPRSEPVKCVGHRPGRDFGRAIANGVHYKKVMWAAYDDFCVYPHEAKDVGDMTDDEIRQCLRNAVSNFEYVQWNIENADLV